MAAPVGHFEHVGLIDLLGVLYAHAEGLAVAQGGAAALVDRKFRVDQVAVLLDQDARADVRRIDQLLVGREREDDVAVRLEALLDVFDKVGDEDRHHRLVVDGAAAAEEALHFLQLERVEIPVLALGLDHVEVAEQEDRLARAGAAQPRTAADVFVLGLLPVVRAIQNTGANTLEAITCALNERGVRTARGIRWYGSSVANLLALAQKFATVPSA